MNTKILCVDDEPNVLEAFSRSLRKDFNVFVAESGDQALAMIESHGPFAVIVSDMRMPGMDGIQFLMQARKLCPDTVRVMLTGNADQQTARDAVNQGHIFSFLTKPCPPETLIETLHAGIERFHLKTTEKELLEETLNKSIEVLVDILAIVNPTAFSRSTRVKKMAREIADGLGVDNAWEIESAALLSQIGCVTVPEDILQKISNGMPLSNRETGLYHQHPQIGHDLIARIPRMENVASMIADQNVRYTEELSSLKPPVAADGVTIGARILKVVLDFDKLILGGHSARSAFEELSERAGWYDPHVFAVLHRIVEGPVEEYLTLVISVADLEPGMMLGSELISVRGSVLLPVGQEISMSLILRLRNLVESGVITDNIRVSVRKDQRPPPAASTVS